MIEELTLIAAEAIEKGAQFLDVSKEIETIGIPEILEEINIEETREVLPSMIEDIAQRVGDYFGIDDFSVTNGAIIGFNTDPETTCHGSVFNYNLNLLKELNCTSPEDVNKIFTQKCAAHILKNKYQDTVTKELGSDFFTGVRNQMLGLQSGHYEQMLPKLAVDSTLPDQLKLRAIEFGRNVYADLQNMGVEPTFHRCLEEFDNSTFSKINVENILNGIQSVQLSVQPTFTGLHPQQIVYGVHRLLELPEVKQYIDECKSAFADSLAISETKLEQFFSGIYNDIKSFFTLQEIDAREIMHLGGLFVEQREFGLDKCSEAAKNIFNLGIIENWSTLSLAQRKEIAGVYAAEVAQAFELKKYTGIYFENLEQGVGGFNRGDGCIHLSNDIIGAQTSPLEIMNIITHELRHQYQSESLQGLHHVEKQVIKEWSIAEQIYNYDKPSCYDPWGYTYNPLELDARYAGETVVRNFTQDLFNV